MNFKARATYFSNYITIVHKISKALSSLLKKELYTKFFIYFAIVNILESPMIPSTSILEIQSLINNNS